MMSVPSSANRIAEAGADVTRIAESSVAIKVDDIDADEVRRHPVWPLCRALRGVGIGTIGLHGAIDYLDELSEAMPGAAFTQFPAAWTDVASGVAASAADIVVDLSNDGDSKVICSALCAQRPAHFISVAFGRTWMGLVSTNRADEREDLHAVLGDEDPPLPPVSRLVAGVALQEILAVAGQLDLVAPAAGEVGYNAASDDRRGWDAPDAWTAPVVEGAIAEVIGAGAIGVHLLESLAPMMGKNSALRIFDPDQVGPENLPLQIPYTPDDVGRSKALAIAEKLTGLCPPGLNLQPFVMPYEQRPESLSIPSVRVACADTFAARKYANDLSLTDGVPLVEAGSSPLAAQQRTYYPGRTACLEHRIRDLDEKTRLEEKRASCAQNRALTLPGTNMVIAGVLATEVLRALRPEVFGWPSRGTITYDARAGRRFGITDRRPPCDHTKAARTDRDTNGGTACHAASEA